jgi:hypothetical protein
MSCVDSGPCVSEADRSIQRAVTGLNRSVQQAFANKINLKEILPLAAGVYGIFSDKTAPATQWLNWLQFAFNTYISLHEEEPRAEWERKFDALGAQMIERQQLTTEALSAELATIRAELRRLADRLHAPTQR